MAPVAYLGPAASATLREDWYLFEGVKFENTDDSIDKNVLPLVRSVVK